MCRLFGLHAGRRLITATFWLLDAPDNLAETVEGDRDDSASHGAVPTDVARVVAVVPGDEPESVRFERWAVPDVAKRRGAVLVDSR